MRKSDIAALSDDSAYNVGFIAIKPTEFSINVFRRMRSITDTSATTPDQEALNVVLGDENPSVTTLDKNRLTHTLYKNKKSDRFEKIIYWLERTKEGK